MGQCALRDGFSEIRSATFATLRHFWLSELTQTRDAVTGAVLSQCRRCRSVAEPIFVSRRLWSQVHVASTSAHLRGLASTSRSVSVLDQLAHRLFGRKLVAQFRWPECTISRNAKRSAAWVLSSAIAGADPPGGPPGRSSRPHTAVALPRDASAPTPLRRAFRPLRFRPRQRRQRWSERPQRAPRVRPPCQQSPAPGRAARRGQSAVRFHRRTRASKPLRRSTTEARGAPARYPSRAQDRPGVTQKIQNMPAVFTDCGFIACGRFLISPRSGHAARGRDQNARQ